MALRIDMTGRRRWAWVVLPVAAGAALLAAGASVWALGAAGGLSFAALLLPGDEDRGQRNLRGDAGGRHGQG